MQHGMAIWTNRPKVVLGVSEGGFRQTSQWLKMMYVNEPTCLDPIDFCCVDFANSAGGSPVLEAGRTRFSSALAGVDQSLNDCPFEVFWPLRNLVREDNVRCCTLRQAATCA